MLKQLCGGKTVHVVFKYLSRRLPSFLVIKMVQCLGLPLAEAMGQTLKHAGVAVTITSCTDVFAFAIGAVTVIHTDKKEKKISSYIGKFRWDRVQSHI